MFITRQHININTTSRVKQFCLWHQKQVSCGLQFRVLIACNIYFTFKLAFQYCCWNMSNDRKIAFSLRTNAQNAKPKWVQGANNHAVNLNDNILIPENKHQGLCMQEVETLLFFIILWKQQICYYWLIIISKARKKLQFLTMLSKVSELCKAHP